MKPQSRRTFLKTLAAASVGTVVPSAFAQGTGMRPNVLLIVVDDLNDYVTGMGGHPQARTPNLERLAAQSVSFRRAYTNNPVCAPSRASLFSGVYPHTARMIHFGKWFENECLVNTKMIPEHFGGNGYRTLGTGKLLHHWRPNIWEINGHRANYGPFAYNGKEPVAHPSVPEPFRSIGFVDGSFAPLSDVPVVAATNDAPGAAGWYDKPKWNVDRALRYVSEGDRDPMPDERCTQWATEQIETMSAAEQERPFMLGVGYIRPHTPLHAPKRFFDMFPKAEVELPVIKDEDKLDTHYERLFPPDRKGPRYFRALRDSYPTIEEGLRAYVQAYLACVAFVDEEIGKVLDALDASPFRDNTVVVMTSDHGYNMGEKDFLFKGSLWEESGRVPLIIRTPDRANAGAVVEHPVSLIDIYPTLADLCDIEADTRKSEKGAGLDGFSLVPFLEDPDTDHWPGPQGALTVIQADNRSKDKPHVHHYSLRTERWRYIRYNSGAEELYDHDNDPYEWNNVSDDPALAGTKAELRAELFRMNGRAAQGGESPLRQ